MCRVTSFDERNCQVKVTYVQEDYGIITKMAFPQDLVKDYTVVSFEEFSNFKDRVAKHLCEISFDEYSKHKGK